MYEKMAQSHPNLSRGQVWCTECGLTMRVDTPDALAHGWPKCCGYTMTIDSPEERAALAIPSTPSHTDSQRHTGFKEGGERPVCVQTAKAIGNHAVMDRIRQSKG